MKLKEMICVFASVLSKESDEAILVIEILRGQSKENSSERQGFKTSP